MIYYTDPELTIYAGDWVENLRLLPDNSVHCIVTSPPYWGLRNYGCAGQLGMEKTPEEYISKMLIGFAECYRILRHDGTLWLNMGDCYTDSGKGGNPADSKHQKQKTNRGMVGGKQWREDGARRIVGLKPKELVGMPWMLAFALRAEGWYLRQSIIWSKPNPMPESVRDRCTKSHEDIFLLTKRASYFYDADAIKESSSDGTHERRAYKTPDGWDTSTGDGGHGAFHRKGREKGRKLAEAGSGTKNNESFDEAMAVMPSNRNKRSVWEVTTRGYKNAHFATFPPELITPCILAGTSEHGCCAECAAPYKRITKKGNTNLAHQLACGSDQNGEYHGRATKDFALANAQNASAVKARILEGMAETITVGWRKTCKCDCEKVVPCTVLDPFGGSGTTAQVSLEKQRRSIVIELNPNYLPFIKERTFNIPFALL